MLTRTPALTAHRCARLGILVALLLAMVGCNSVPWRYDYGGALQSAAAAHRRAIVLFTSGSSADCREMDFKVFSDAKVQDLMREFVPVRLDPYFNRARAEQMGVKDVPTIIVLRPDGTVAGTQTGKLTSEGLRLFLIKNRFN